MTNYKLWYQELNDTCIYYDMITCIDGDCEMCKYYYQYLKSRQKQITMEDYISAKKEELKKGR